MDSETRKLDRKILSFIRRHPAGRAPDAEFNALALEIFGHQFRRNRPYRAWCRNEGKDPGAVRGWKDIPALPAEAFKRLRVASFPARQTRRIFRTSGTTAARRGVHAFDTLKLYEASIVGPFRRHLLADGARLSYYFLTGSPQDAPDSSLSHMMGVVNETFAGRRGRYVVRRGRPDYPGLAHRLLRETKKVFLLSTAFALKGFLDFLANNQTPLKLRPGSRIFETGGFKGRTKAVSKRELYRQCGRFLGVPAGRIASEYGMTELSSQFYDGAPPAWMRTVVVDPGTGREARPGRPGLLRHVDLANRGSVIAVETEDWGRLRGGRIELLGRAWGAERRGCSLAFEEFLRR